MIDYAAKAVAASKTIQAKGQKMQLVYGSVSGYGAGVPDTLGAATEYPWGVVVEYSEKDITGGQIKVGDKQVILEAPADMTPPQTKDALVIGGAEHSIVAVMPISPADIPVIYHLQVRMGA